MKGNSIPRIADFLVPHTLSNGLRIYVCPNRRAPVFSAYMTVTTGSIHEEEFLGCGLSHFLEHMLFTGTRKFPGASEISDRAAAAGASLNAWTSATGTTYYMEAPASALEDVLNMLCDMVSDPLFPEELFHREKDVILRECAMRDDNPRSVLFESLLGTLFRTAPCRIPVIGFRECIETVDRDMMNTYYRRRYSPHRCFLTVCGDTDPADVFRILERNLGAWKRRGLADPVIPAEEPFSGIRRSTRAFHDVFARSAQGFLVPPGEISARSLAPELLCDILAGSDSARLVTGLRNNRELVSDIGISTYGAGPSETLFAHFTAAPEKLDAAHDALQNEFRRLLDNGVTEEELRRTKRLIRTDRLNIFRSNESLARTLVSYILRFGTPDEIDACPEKIEALTAQDLLDSARKILTLENCADVRVIPESMTLKQKTKAFAPAPAKPVLHTLPGRRKAVILTDRDTPFLSLTAVLPGGTLCATEKTAGFGSLLAATLSCGAGPYSEEEFNGILDDLAIQLDVIPGLRETKIILEAEPDVFPEGLRMLSLMLSEPHFPEKAFEREKDDLIRTLEAAMMQPESAALNAARTAFFRRGTPFALGLEDIIRAVRQAAPDDMRRYLRNVVLSAPGSCFSVAGPCTEKKALDFLDSFLKNVPWTSRRPKTFRAEAAPRRKGRIIRHVPRQQAIPLLILPFPGVETPEIYLAEKLLSRVFSGLASPLFKNVREAEGLAYHVSAQILQGYGQSALLFAAGTRPDAADRVFRKFREERQRLAETGLTKEELEHARMNLEFLLARRMQDPAAKAALCCLDEYRGYGMECTCRILGELPGMDLAPFNKFVRSVFSADPGLEVLVTPEKNAKKSKIS